MIMGSRCSARPDCRARTSTHETCVAYTCRRRAMRSRSELHETNVRSLRPRSEMHETNMGDVRPSPSPFRRGLHVVRRAQKAGRGSSFFGVGWGRGPALFEASGGVAVRRRVLVGPSADPKKEGPLPAALGLPWKSLASAPKKPF
jgi:hypothetical protein